MNQQLTAGQQAEMMREEKISAILNYIKHEQDKTVIFEIAEAGGFTPQQALFVMENGSAPITSVINLYNAMLSVKNKRDLADIKNIISIQFVSAGKPM